MANKKEIPAIENPLANMGLDDIVRELTFNEDNEKSEKDGPAKRRSRAASKKNFENYLDKYIGISEQGAAIWMPKEVKKKLEIIRANADRNIPLRSLAAAIIMAYIDENKNIMDNL